MKFQDIKFTKYTMKDDYFEGRGAAVLLKNNWIVSIQQREGGITPWPFAEQPSPEQPDGTFEVAVMRYDPRTEDIIIDPIIHEYDGDKCYTVRGWLAPNEVEEIIGWAERLKPTHPIPDSIQSQIYTLYVDDPKVPRATIAPRDLAKYEVAELKELGLKGRKLKGRKLARRSNRLFRKAMRLEKS